MDPPKKNREDRSPKSASPTSKPVPAAPLTQLARDSSFERRDTPRVPPMPWGCANNAAICVSGLVFVVLCVGLFTGTILQASYDFGELHYEVDVTYFKASYKITRALNQNTATTPIPGGTPLGESSNTNYELKAATCGKETDVQISAACHVAATVLAIPMGVAFWLDRDPARAGTPMTHLPIIVELVLIGLFSAQNVFLTATLEKAGVNNCGTVMPGLERYDIGPCWWMAAIAFGLLVMFFTVHICVRYIKCCCYDSNAELLLAEYDAAEGPLLTVGGQQPGVGAGSEQPSLPLTKERLEAVQLAVAQQQHERRPASAATKKKRRTSSERRREKTEAVTRSPKGGQPEDENIIKTNSTVEMSLPVNPLGLSSTEPADEASSPRNHHAVPVAAPKPIRPTASQPPVPLQRPRTANRGDNVSSDSPNKNPDASAIEMSALQAAGDAETVASPSKSAAEKAHLAEDEEAYEVAAARAKARMLANMV